MPNKSITSQSTSLPLAGLGRRIGALFYEAVLLTALIVVLAILFQLVFPSLAEHRYLQLLLFACEIIFTYFYFHFCWKKGQTLAMKTWRIRLCRLDSQPITIWQILGRYYLSLITFIPLIPITMMVKHEVLPHYAAWIAIIWAAFPYLWAMLDKDKQFLHDRILGTRLVFVAPAQKKPK